MSDTSSLKSSPISDTFLTEVDTTLLRTIKTFNDFNRDDDEEKAKKKKTILSCAYPFSFEGDEPSPFPRQQRLDPLYVIRKAVTRFFPDQVDPAKHQKESIQQFQSVFMCKASQNFLIDSFWWVFIEIFGLYYMQSKAYSLFKAQLESAPATTRSGFQTGRSNYSGLNTIRSGSNQYTARSMNSTAASMHMSDVLGLPTAIMWIEAKQRSMSEDQDIIFGRMAKNYGDVYMSILSERHNRYSKLSTRRIARVCSSKYEKLYPELTIRALLLAFGANFPDSVSVFDSSDFQMKLTILVNTWFYGEKFSTTKMTKELGIITVPKDMEEEGHAEKPVARLKRVVKVLRFIHRVKREAQINNNTATEEHMNSLIKQVQEVHSDRSQVVLDELNTMFNSHKDWVTKQYNDYLTEQKRLMRRMIRRGEIPQPSKRGTDIDSDDDSYSDIDSAYLSEENLENEMDQHRSRFNWKFDYSIRPELIKRSTIRRPVTAGNGKLNNMASKSTTDKSKLRNVPFNPYSCLKESPLISRYIHDVRSGIQKQTREKTRSSRLENYTKNRSFVHL